MIFHCAQCSRALLDAARTTETASRAKEKREEEEEEEEEERKKRRKKKKKKKKEERRRRKKRNKKEGPLDVFTGITTVATSTRDQSIQSSSAVHRDVKGQKNERKEDEEMGGRQKRM